MHRVSTKVIPLVVVGCLGVVCGRKLKKASTLGMLALGMRRRPSRISLVV